MEAESTLIIEHSDEFGDASTTLDLDAAGDALAPDSSSSASLASDESGRGGSFVVGVESSWVSVQE